MSDEKKCPVFGISHHDDDCKKVHDDCKKDHVDSKKEKKIKINNILTCCPTCPPPVNGVVCPATGELLQNGGMENFTANIPTGWMTTTPNLISQETGQGRVHSGNSSVRLLNGAILTQTVTGITPGCPYQFALNANGDGAQVSFTARVIFIVNSTEIMGGEIFVRQQDVPTAQREFNYYQIFTSKAPDGTTAARVEISVTAVGMQALLLDDVSLGSD